MLKEEGDTIPLEIRLIRSFLNTREIAEATDLLASPEGLRQWLEDMGLPGRDENPLPGDVELMVGIREALRDVLSEHNGNAVPWASIELLNRATQRIPLVLRFDDQANPTVVAVAPGVAGSIGRIWEAVVSARAHGTWERLKACRRPDCRWIFFDRSKNRSASWCSTEGCGALMKSRAYRRRRTARLKRNQSMKSMGTN